MLSSLVTGISEGHFLLNLTEVWLKIPYGGVLSSLIAQDIILKIFVYFEA